MYYWRKITSFSRLMLYIYVDILFFYHVCWKPQSNNYYLKEPSSYSSVRHSVRPSIHPFIHPSIYPSIYLSIYLIYLPTYLPIYLSIYLSLNVCLSDSVCVCMYVCMYAHTHTHTCTYICMYACMHVCMYVRIFTTFPYSKQTNFTNKKRRPTNPPQPISIRNRRKKELINKSTAIIRNADAC